MDTHTAQVDPVLPGCSVDSARCMVTLCMAMDSSSFSLGPFCARGLASARDATVHSGSMVRGKLTSGAWRPLQGDAGRGGAGGEDNTERSELSESQRAEEHGQRPCRCKHAKREGNTTI